MKTVNIVRKVKLLVSEVIEDVYKFLTSVVVTDYNFKPPTLLATCLYTTPTATTYRFSVDLLSRTITQLHQVNV